MILKQIESNEMINTAWSLKNHLAYLLEDRKPYPFRLGANVDIKGTSRRDT